MKTSTFLLALALPLFAPQDALRCAPEKGLALRKVFECKGELELVAQEMTVDGASHGDMPKPELSIELNEELAFLDRCAQVEGGRATEIVRTYEKLSETGTQRTASSEGSDEQTVNAESELEGETVVFTWDADAKEWDAAFEGGEGDSKLLEGLQAELDLCAFLPPGPVAEGESWDVPATAFAALICPGGDLKLRTEEGEERNTEVQLARNLQGKIRATLGATGEDGLARIDLELELSARAERELEDGSGNQNQTNEYELSGALEWRRAAGHFEGIELAGKVHSTILSARDAEMGGNKFHVERTLEFAGDVSYRLRASAP
jgi:hypothetical protein